MEETCAHALMAGEDLEIGLASSNMLKHILPPAPRNARESVWHSGCLSDMGALEGVCGGRGGCPTRKVAGADGSDLCRTNDPGHQVSPAPLLRLAVFIPKCT